MVERRLDRWLVAPEASRELAEFNCVTGRCGDEPRLQPGRIAFAEETREVPRQRPHRVERGVERDQGVEVGVLRRVQVLRGRTSQAATWRGGGGAIPSGTLRAARASRRQGASASRTRGAAPWYLTQVDNAVSEIEERRAAWEREDQLLNRAEAREVRK